LKKILKLLKKILKKSNDRRCENWHSFFSFSSRTVEGNSRKTANLYGVHYANSYACSNGAPSVYTSTGCCTNINGSGFNVHQPQPHEDYRPIYFYVAQPYTIPYPFAKRPKPAASSLLRAAKPRGNNCRVKFSKRLGNADFSQKVKQGEFSRSLNQVHFAESQGQGNYTFFQFTEREIGRAYFQTDLNLCFLKVLCNHRHIILIFKIISRLNACQLIDLIFTMNLYNKSLQ